MEQVSFDVSSHDAGLIAKIASRARSLEASYGKPSPLIEWVMDFTATHANGNPLRLADLLAADGFNFMHDAFGICRHLDRETGKLTDFFLPRFSVPDKSDLEAWGAAA